MIELTVGEWNVHWGVARAPRVPRARVFDVVATMPPPLLAADVLVLPEAWRANDGSSFLDQLADHGFAHVLEVRFATLVISTRRRKVVEPGEGWWVLALASRHPIVAHDEIPLAHGIGDQVPQRHAITATLDVHGRHVDVVAFHVSSKLWWAAPWVHLRSLDRGLAARGIDGGHRPAIAVGDANLWRTWLPTALPGWQPLVRGASFPAWRPHSQIDHILGRGAVAPIDGRVLPVTRTSDHRPVIARVALT